MEFYYVYGKVFHNFSTETFTMRVEVALVQQVLEFNTKFDVCSKVHDDYEFRLNDLLDEDKISWRKYSMLSDMASMFQYNKRKDNAKAKRGEPFYLSTDEISYGFGFTKQQAKQVFAEGLAKDNT